MTEERALLAGGCFWGVQDLFRHHDGVISTRVGYTGGDVPDATYRNHGTHAEAIEIIFDPSKISYRKLLEFFFQIHDPTTRNRQGGDVGIELKEFIPLQKIDPIYFESSYYLSPAWPNSLLQLIGQFPDHPPGPRASTEASGNSSAKAQS